MQTNLKSTILAAFGLLSLAIAVPMSVANAQGRGGGQQGGGPGGGGQGGPPPMMGGGAIAVDQQNVYVLQGPRIFKLDKGTLRVVQQGQLPMGPPPGGNTGGGPGGGGGDVPPPTEEATK